MKGKMLKRVFAAGLSAAMLMSMSIGASAASVTYQVPHQAMDVDSNLILCAAHAQADCSPEIIGLTNTTDRAREVPADYSLDFAQSSALIGTFGTAINDSPNPFLYNWAYNSWAQENGATLADKHTIGGLSANPTAVDTAIIAELGTSASLYYRPEILIGSTGGDYSTLIADLPENKDSNPDNDYDPTIISYPIVHAYDFLSSLYDMANAAEDVIKANPQKHTRYGDPLDVADQLTRYDVGLQSYVLQQIAQGNVQKKTVAIFDPEESKDGNFYCTDANTSTWTTTSHSRPGEFLDATTDNVIQKVGKSSEVISVNKSNGTANKTAYNLTAEEIVSNADVIITAGTNAVGGNHSADEIRESLITYLNGNQELINKVQSMPIMSSTFSTVGTIGANSIENLLGMAYWTGFVYPECFNPVDSATYWYKHFYHVSDNAKLEEIISDNMASASKPDGVAATTSTYNENDFQAKIDAGMAYYNTGAVTNDIITNMAANLNHSNNNNNNTKPTSASDFTDVNTSDWFYDAVDYAVKNNITSGTSNTTFSPNMTTSRGQFVTFLYNAEKTPVTIETPMFSDVSSDAYYANPVVWCYRHNIVAGTSATTFSPDNNVTREQIAVMLYNAAKNDGKTTTASGSLSSFSDASSVDSWATEAMQWAVGNGIIAGANGQILPQADASRAQAVAMIERYANLS